MVTVMRHERFVHHRHDALDEVVVDETPHGVLEDHPALAAIRPAETAASHGGTVIIERPAT